MIHVGQKTIYYFDNDQKEDNEIICNHLYDTQLLSHHEGHAEQIRAIV